MMKKRRKDWINIIEYEKGLDKYHKRGERRG